MQIGTFNELLKNQKPQAYAYVPEKVGKRQSAVNVVFSPNGKVYTYKGTILAVATRLDLIPEVDVWKESQRAVRELKTGTAIAPIECSDTINYLLNLPGKIAQEIDRVTDEYGRDIATYKIAVSEWV